MTAVGTDHPLVCLACDTQNQLVTANGFGICRHCGYSWPVAAIALVPYSTLVAIANTVKANGRGELTCRYWAWLPTGAWRCPLPHLPGDRYCGSHRDHVRRLLAAGQPVTAGQAARVVPIPQPAGVPAPEPIVPMLPAPPPRPAIAQIWPPPPVVESRPHCRHRYENGLRCANYRGQHPQFCGVHRPKQAPVPRTPYAGWPERPKTVALAPAPTPAVIIPPLALPADRRCQHRYDDGRRCGNFRGEDPQWCGNHRPDRYRQRAQPPIVWPPKHRVCQLTDTDCWAQSKHSRWQQEETRLGWHRELLIGKERSPTVCTACDGRDLTWNGRSWWCNGCQAQVDPEAPTIEEAIVYDVGLPTSPYAVASLGALRDDSDRYYRDQTMLFHAGAISNRPYGWVSPRWDRWKEGRGRRRRRS